ncbi:PBSX family phage terminase large subunit [Flavonifractor sp. An100]|uniref:PBSX family phage terminase large subunit n=1 Tax=Flavonifractor sp. An100 TaxID=1965538 RepID=UPI000B37D201|nr:PBSX family phage terminase large subunit [Flavonifractor sp. An100]OUQ77991.1 terminase [Flavonifractor sp. An100]
MVFSPKQRQVLTWWRPNSPHWDRQAIICDGAVRSGKTLCTGLSFFCWAMRSFHRRNFALCGKTIVSVRRNLLDELLPLLQSMGFQCDQKVSRNILKVRLGNHANTFYLFGGKDEGSAALIQGITLAGALLDEVALMPRSFVEQAVARCSVTGSRLWFSCNPESPAHWFYREWILKAEEKKVLRLQFTMADNPGLSPEVLRRYQDMFQGTFYRRFVLGEWVAAEGRVYDFFDESYVAPLPQGELTDWHISCDYGTLNPTSMGLWGRQGGVWYRVAEFYYDARQQRRQKTDEEYADALAALAGGREIQGVVVDPSAASFLETLRRRGWRVRKAHNEVLAGIRLTARLLKSRRLVICQGCADAIREFSLYRWEEQGDGQDRVRKEHDHAMDEIRYFAATVAARDTGSGEFFALGVERGAF